MQCLPAATSVAGPEWQLAFSIHLLRTTNSFLLESASFAESTALFSAFGDNRVLETEKQRAELNLCAVFLYLNLKTKECDWSVVCRISTAYFAH